MNSVNGWNGKMARHGIGVCFDTFLLLLSLFSDWVSQFALTMNTRASAQTERSKNSTGQTRRRERKNVSKCIFYFKVDCVLCVMILMRLISPYTHYTVASYHVRYLPTLANMKFKFNAPHSVVCVGVCLHKHDWYDPRLRIQGPHLCELCSY